MKLFLSRIKDKNPYEPAVFTPIRKSDKFKDLKTCEWKSTIIFCIAKSSYFFLNNITSRKRLFTEDWFRGRK